MKAGWADSRRPVRVALLRRAAAQQLRVGRLAHDDLGVGALLGQHARHALQRAAGAVARHPVVERIAGEVAHDLLRRRARVHVGVGLVLELARQEPAVRLGELDGLRHHAHAALRGRRQHHLGAEEAHQLAPLDAEGLGHRHDQRIALLGADHGEPDAGVAAGGLDHRLARLQLAGLLGGLDDAERQAVLDRAQRIEGLDLDEQVGARRGQPVDPHHRRVADRLQDVLILALHGGLRWVSVPNNDAPAQAAA